MESVQLPKGNGQKIYIEPDLLYIDSEWIDQELGTITMPEIPANQSNPVYEAYKELFKRLSELGYRIVTDGREVDEETFFFSPCFDVHINTSKEEYKSKKIEKIMFHLANYGITSPTTVFFPKDSFPSDIPTLPFILKNENRQGGAEKYLIRTPQQLELLMKFYNEINAYSREKAAREANEEWPYDEKLVFDEKGHSQYGSGISIWIKDYKKKFHKNMAIQKYVKTPTKYNTSLRVLTSSSGEVFCASLKYSEGVKEESEKKYYGDFDVYLSDPASPYFLGSESIVSNTVAGGESILLGKDNYTDLEREILAAHGIDPDDVRVPDEVYKACISVAETCKREIGALCGMDFIYDEEAGVWKYLEEHEFPMLYSYAEKYGLPYDPTARDFDWANQLLDIKVRLHALALTMQKKQSLSPEDGKHI